MSADDFPFDLRDQMTLMRRIRQHTSLVDIAWLDHQLPASHQALQIPVVPPESDVHLVIPNVQRNTFPNRTKSFRSTKCPVGLLLNIGVQRGYTSGRLAADRDTATRVIDELIRMKLNLKYDIFPDLE